MYHDVGELRRSVARAIHFRRNTGFPKCFQRRGTVCDMGLLWLPWNFSYMSCVATVKRGLDEKSEIRPVGKPESCVLRAA